MPSTRVAADDVANPAAPRVLLDEPTRRLCSEVSGGTLAPARLAIVAPGGYGKSAVLAELARGCTARGTAVAHVERATTDAESVRASGSGADLVLVDDAHELSDTVLAELRALADSGAGLVIAARPWPRPAALTTLLSALDGQIVLRALDARRIASLLGPARAALAEFVHAQTLGVPGFATRLVAALKKDDSVRTPPAALPTSVLTEFRPDLDRLAPRTLTLLLAATSGAGLDIDLLAGLLGTDHDGVSRAVDAARACGLLSQNGVPLPLVARAVRALVGDDRRLAVSRRLVRLQLDRGGPVLDLVRPLLGGGLSGGEPAEAFEVAGDEAVTDDPALAATLYAAASAAGRVSPGLGARWAESSARAGDFDTALRLADRVIADEGADDRPDAATTAATVLVRKGQLDRAAELYAWSATPLGRMHGALVCLRKGRLDQAERLLSEPDGGAAPTLLSGAVSALARGTVESVTDSAVPALTTLAGAAETLEPVGRSLLLPESPAAVAALVGMQCGELSLADTLLRRAVAAEVGGPTAAPRHRLLRAWIALLRGDTDRALRATTSAASEPTEKPESSNPAAALSTQDVLLRSALRVGVARRTSDLAALRTSWDEARDVVVRAQVELFSLLPLGELAVAAARLGEADRIAHQLRRARDLLSALGAPPLWSVTLHWNALHAAILADHREEAEEHARALSRISGHSRYHAAVADAAGCWLDTLGGTIDAGRVKSAAHALHALGLSWDAARLAGQAAIRTTDRAAMVVLLECARALQGSPGGAGGARAGSGTPVLSERERQVAELVVSGLTYKQVGDRLFISAKTVEHHMARMRGRLGATSRTELLAQLRSLVLH